LWDGESVEREEEREEVVSHLWLGIREPNAHGRRGLARELVSVSCGAAQARETSAFAYPTGV